MLRCLALLALLALPALSQDQDPTQVLAKFRAYLDRRPFHEAAFERLIDTAVSVDGLSELVAEYELAAAAEDAPRDVRVVLARLYAAVERADEALALLAELEGDETELHLLRGRLALEAGRVEEASSALDQAAAGTDDPHLLEEIHTARGRARLTAGDHDGARAAFADLANLDPESFHLRFLVADALAAAGLFDQAIAGYLAAADLAREDTARRCRALAAAGGLLEARDRPDEAIARYDEAIDLMSRGNWLKRDLCARVLAASRRSQGLEDLAASLAMHTADQPSDLDRRELYAAVLLELRDTDGARAALEAAVGDFPDDLALGRRLLDVLETADDVDARVAEYQRLIERHPGQLELYLELGSLFAEEGRLEQARRQWERTLEQRLDDPSLCVRLAALYAVHELFDEALGTLERAVELEPRELNHLAELAGVLVRAGRRDQLPAVLDRARAAAENDAGRLEEFADLARGLRFHDRAREALTLVLEQEPDSPRALRALADLALASGDRAEAVRALRHILTTSRDDAARRDAVGRILRLHQRSGMEALTRAELERAEDDPTAHYLLARAAMLRRRSEDAIEHFEAYVAAVPGDELGRTELARLYAEDGREEDAIALYEALMEARPQSRGTWLRRVAALHVADRRRGDALACYEEVLDLSPDSAPVFSEVAGHLQSLGETERALECLRQAVRLRPDAGRYHLQLADALVTADQVDAARAHVLEALGDADEAVRSRARAWIYEDLVEHGKVDHEIRRLRAYVASSPYDNAASEALIDLFVRELEYALALDLMGDRLAFDPANARLLQRRARLYEEMERWSEALVDHATLARLPGVDAEAALLGQARCALRLGDRERAERALSGVTDPLAVVQTYSRDGLHEAAIDALRAAQVHLPGDAQLQQRLVSLFERTGQFDRALAAHEELMQLQGSDWQNLRRHIDLLCQAGNEAGLREAGAQLMSMTTPAREPQGEASRVRIRRNVNRQRSTHRKHLEELRQLFEERGRLPVLVDVVRARLQETPGDEELFNLGLQILAPTQILYFNNKPEHDYAGAIDLVDEVRALTLGDELVLPAGHTRASWKKVLDRSEDRLVKADPDLARLRVEELAGVELEAMTMPALDERLELLRAQGEPHEVIAALRQGRQRFPDQLKYRAALAIILSQEGDLEKAVPELEALLAATGAEGERTARRPDDEGADKRYHKRLIKKLPEELRDGVTDEEVLTLYRIGRPSPLRGDWMHTRVPDALDVRIVLARALVDLDRTDEALSILEPVAPASLEFVEWAATLSKVYRELDADEHADELDRGVFSVIREVEASPVLRHGRVWRPQTRELMGRIVAGLDDHEQRHELTRRWTGQAPSWTAEERAQLTETFGERWETARQGGDELTRHSAGVLYAELLQAEERWTEAAAVLGALREFRPEDRDLGDALVSVEVRGGNAAGALALIDQEMEDERRRYEETGKRSADRRPTFSETVPVDPYMLVPACVEGPGSTPEDKILFGELAQAQFFGTPQGNAKGPNLVTLRVQAVRAAWLAGDWARVGREYTALNQENKSVISYCRWETERALNARQVGAEAVEIYSVLYEFDRDDVDLVLGYGKRLEQSDRADEAIRIYRKFLHGKLAVGKGRGSLDHRTRLVYTELERLDPTAAMPEEEPLPADLAAAVEADPKNAGLRMALVEDLLRQHRLEEALIHARAVSQLAFHLEGVRQMLEGTLLATGADEEYEELLNEQLDSTVEGSERLRLAVALANRAHARGAEVSEINEIFERAERRGPMVKDDHTLARWWMDHGFDDEALAWLRLDRERMGSRNWYLDEIDTAIARLEEGQGDLREMLESIWKGREGPDSFDGIVELLLERRDAAEVLEEVLGDLEGEQAALVRAADEVVRGDSAAAEERLASLAESAVSYRGYFPFVIDMARGRGDQAAALALLDRLEVRYPCSDRRIVETGVGKLGERQLAACLRGQLQAAAGDPDAAIATWREALGRDDAHLQIAARLCLSIGRADDAVALLGEVREPDREFEAAAAYVQGDLAAELVAVDAILAMTEGDTDHRERARRRRFTLLRQLGRGDELEAILRRTLQVNPSDELAALALIDLTWERHGEAVALALFDGALDPSRLSDLRDWAAARLRARGDHAHALEWYLESHGAAEGWAKDQLTEPLRELLLSEGRAEELVDYSGRYDAVRATRLVQAAAFLREKGQAPDLQRAWLEEALSLAEESLPLDEHVQLLLHLDRADDAVALIATRAADRTLDLDVLAHAYMRLKKETARLDAEQARLDRLEDLAAARAAAALRYARNQDLEALAALDRLLALGGDPQRVLDRRWRVLKRLDRPAEAAAVLVRCLDLIDRSKSLPGSIAGRVYSYRQSLFRLRLAADGAAAAVAEFRTKIGERFGQPNISTYRLWWLDNNFSTDDRNLKQLLWSHGLYAEYVQMLRAGDSTHNTKEMQLARAWLGERDAVLRELTETLLMTDPGRPQVVDRGNFIEMTEYDSEQPRLWARLAFEADEVDERRSALDGASGRVRSDVDEALAVLRGDAAGIVAAIEARGGSTVDHTAEWTAVGRHGEVYQALAALRAETPFTEVLEGEPFGANVEPLSFQFGEVQRNLAIGFGGSVVAWPLMSSDSSEHSHVTSRTSWSDVQWIAVCLRTGRTDEARVAVEEELTRRRNLAQSRPGTALANELLRTGLVDEARELHARFVEEDYPDADEAAGKRRTFMRAAMMRAARNGDDAGHLFSLVAELPLPEKPSVAAYDHWWSATAFERAGADATWVQNEVDAARALDPEGRQEPKGARRAWITLAVGDAAVAEELFRAGIAEARADGSGIDEHRYGLGLALAAQGREEAGEVLRHALAAAPSYERAARARAALGL